MIELLVELSFHLLKHIVLIMECDFYKRRDELVEFHKWIGINIVRFMRFELVIFKEQTQSITS
jgi:hypothetical protein